jgi:hypothetical protein
VLYWGISFAGEFYLASLRLAWLSFQGSSTYFGKFQCTKAIIHLPSFSSLLLDLYNHSYTVRTGTTSEALWGELHKRECYTKTSSSEIRLVHWDEEDLFQWAARLRKGCSGGQPIDLRWAKEQIRLYSHKWQPQVLQAQMVGRQMWPWKWWYGSRPKLQVSHKRNEAFDFSTILTMRLTATGGIAELRHFTWKGG